MGTYAPNPLARRGGAWGVGGIGVGLLCVAGAYAVGFLTAVEVSLSALTDLVLLAVMGATVAYSGYRLGDSDLAERELWLVAISVGLGVIGGGLLMAWSVLALADAGVPAETTLLQVAIGQTVGALGGLLVGLTYVRGQRRARQRGWETIAATEGDRQGVETDGDSPVQDGAATAESADTAATAAAASGTETATETPEGTETAASTDTALSADGDGAPDARTAREQFAFLNHMLRHHLFNGVQVIEANADALSPAVEGTAATRLETIQHRSDRLVALVENLKVFVDAMEDDRSFEAIDLTAHLDAEVRRLEQSAEAVTVEVSAPETAAVQADALLQTALENVLRVAAQCDPAPEPQVGVTVETDESMVVVTVESGGPPVDDRTDLATLRDRDLTETVSEESLRLLVTEQLVASYDGTFAVHERADGTAYELRLPQVPFAA